MTSGRQRATLRAGIVVTGTEVLSGAVADRNGPWLSERLREQGVEVAHIIVDTGDQSLGSLVHKLERKLEQFEAAARRSDSPAPTG